MKKTTNPVSHLCVLFTICALTGVSTLAQSKGRSESKSPVQSFVKIDEKANVNSVPQEAPYDFSDTYYIMNGVEAPYVVGRRNGADKKSVVDYPAGWEYSDVRVIETLPAYTHKGQTVFFNHFGDLHVEGFTTDDIGQALLQKAEETPVYVFISNKYKGKATQAALIDLNADDPAENPLGVRVVCHVTFNITSMTVEDGEFLAAMVESNGASLDGNTPIVKSSEDLMSLLMRGLVSIRLRGHGESTAPDYAIVPIMSDPTGTAIRWDAYLSLTSLDNGKPLIQERPFLNTFVCLQQTGSYCQEQ